MLFSRKTLVILSVLTYFTIAAGCVSSGVFNNFDYAPKNPSVIATQSTVLIFGFTNGPRSNVINFNFGAPCTSDLTCSFTGKDQYGPYESSNNNALLTITPIKNKNATYLIPFEATVPGICSETGIINLTVVGNNTNISANLTGELTALTNSVTNDEKADYYVKVKNNLNVDTFVELTSINFLLDSQTNYEATLFKLKAGEERTLKISVFIPAEFPATTPGNPLTWAFVLNDKLFGQQVTLPVNLSIVGTPTDIRLTKAPSSQGCIEVRRGNELTESMEVTNYGEYTGPFTVDLNLPDELQDVVSATPQFFSINKGQKISFNVTAQPNSDTPIKTYPWNLLVKQGGYQVYSYDGCLKVVPDINFTVKYVSNLTIKRNRKSLTPIIVKNTGDTAKMFTITYDPILVDFRFSITPESFTLKSGESTLLSSWFNTTMTTRLGQKEVPFNITDNYSQVFTGTYDLNMITSGLDNETLLKITTPPDQAIPNNTQITTSVIITNKANHELTGVNINIYSQNQIIKTLQTINRLRPKENRKITFILRPSAATYGETLFTINAKSDDGEEVSQDFLLNIVRPDPQVEISQLDAGASLNLKVQNTGNVQLDNIQYFVIDPVSNAVIQAFETFSLNIGDQKQITLPKAQLQKIQDGYQQPLIIKFTNDNQVLVQKPLPLTPTQSIIFNPLYIILIILVLVGAYFMIIKRYEE